MTDTPQRLGRYRLEGKIAEGGMAGVYRAFDEDLHRTVAIKVMKDVIREDKVFAERFVREARMIASFDHPNVLPVFDFGTGGDTVYLVLPLIEGGSLREKLGKPMPPAEVADAIRQVGAALDYAHSRGVLHRDIKPANIMINREGRLLLSDFGIARSEAVAGLTTTGELLGTPNYMSPEQAIGKLLDGRSDQYSLAVMAYEMLTGTVPFRADTPLLVLEKHVREAPVPPSKRVTTLPPALDAVFAKALAKDPKDRFGSCVEFADAIAKASGGARRSTADAPTVLTNPTAGSAAAAGVAAAPVTSRSAVSNIVLLIVGFLLLAGLAIGITYMTGGMGPRTLEPTPVPGVAPVEPTAPPSELPVAPEVTAAASDLGLTPASVPTPAVVATPPPAAPKGPGGSNPPPPAAPRPERNYAQPLIRSSAAAALGGTTAQAYRMLAGRPSREDFARAFGLAREAVNERPGDNEASFLMNYSGAAIAFADGDMAMAGERLSRALASAPRGVLNEDAVYFAREGINAGPLNRRRDAGWELGLAFNDVRGDLLEQLEAAQAREPDNARVLAARAVYFRDKGQTRQAREEAKAACELAGGSYPIACDLERELQR